MMDPSVGLPALLERAATGAKRASERALMREAAECIRRLRQDAADAARVAADARKHAEAAVVRDAARRGYDAGQKDGFARGVQVALDPIEPDHTATVTAWRERRAAAAAEGT